ncbi:MAG: sugar-binding protein [Candidatus Latescibacterota bacterium]
MCRCLLWVLVVVSGANAEPAGFHPRQYIALRTVGTITVDGKLNEASWLRAPSTELFGNMQAPAEPPPYYATRVKMLWDDEYLYFAAMMEDPDILATVTERDGPIYDDNDFEIFMDIDSDGRWYYEFEMNALNVIYDVLIQRRAARLGIEWNIEGLITAVQIDGTLNVADDVDGGWTAEYVAIPETFAPLALDEVSDWVRLHTDLDPVTAVLGSFSNSSPGQLVLSPNYPNPFNSGTVISYTLSVPGPVDLAIYNARGQRLTTLVQTIVAAGRYSVVWNGRDAAGTEVASGVYLYRLRVGSREESRKLLLVR